MINVNGFICQQGQKLLENNRHAMLCAVLLAIFPYTTWLSLTVIALVTLRKGWRDGALLLMPVMTAFLVCSVATAVPTLLAITNTLVTFIPCYFAACVLGMTTSWRAVAGVFFLLLLICAILFQIFMPEFITAQYQYLYAAISELRPDALPKVMVSLNGSNQLILANYLFGLQLANLFISAILPLTLARSIQSQLYYPGGYQQEMHSLRGNKVGVLILLLILVAASQGNLIAINVLPLLVVYFLSAGLSLSFYAFAGKKIRGASLILVIPLVLLPFVMLPVYVILGSLDSLFNLRFYLPSIAGKATDIRG